MKLITNHILWWLVIITGTAAVSAGTSSQITAEGMFTSMAGHLSFAIGAAMIPWIFYRFMGNPLTTEQMMWTITVGWLILAVAKLSVSGYS